MESHPNYLMIVFAYVQNFRERLEMFTIPKIKSILKNFNHRMISIIL